MDAPILLLNKEPVAAGEVKGQIKPYWKASAMYSFMALISSGDKENR